MKRKNSGITLIALVITIIVLLILAGVALSLVAGNEGILTKAETAVTETNKEAAKEQAELMVAEISADYYKKRYVERRESVANQTLAEYIKSQVGGGKTSSNGEFFVTIADDGTVTVYEGSDDTGSVVVTGTLAESGKMIWDNVATGDSESGEGEETPEVAEKYTVTYDANGGTGAPTDSNEYENGATVMVDFATVPTKEGYIFWGWAISSDSTEATYTSTGTTSFTMGEANVTLYAIWEILEVGDTVTYSPSGTYNWAAEYASSSLAGSTDDVVDVALATGTQVADGKTDMSITSWKVFSIDENTGKVELVPSSPSTGTVRLQGPQGYNNGVKLLNDACSNLYGNGSTITARSISMKDIEGAMTEEALAEAHAYVDPETNTTWGNQVSSAYSTIYSYYPTIYAKEDLSVIDGNKIEKNEGLGMSDQTELIGTTDEGATGGLIPTATSIQPYQTYWMKDNSFMQTAFKGNGYSLLIPQGTSTSYWVATRCVSDSGNSCMFSLAGVDGGDLGGYDMKWSYINFRQLRLLACFIPRSFSRRELSKWKCHRRLEG